MPDDSSLINYPTLLTGLSARCLSFLRFDRLIQDNIHSGEAFLLARFFEDLDDPKSPAGHPLIPLPVFIRLFKRPDRMPDPLSGLFVNKYDPAHLFTNTYGNVV